MTVNLLKLPRIYYMIEFIRMKPALIHYFVWFNMFYGLFLAIRISNL